VRRAAALLIAIALLACRQVEKPATPPVPPPRPLDASENGNLLNMAFGASVVSRTAEQTLEASAVRAIDGDPESAWTSPPADNNQTIVFALPAPARIEQVGVRTDSRKSFAVTKIRFEASSDSKTFTTIAEPQLASSEEPQLFPITPVTASYLRVTTTEAPGLFALLKSVHARGTYMSQPTAQPIAGCWKINGKRAEFIDETGRIRGVIGEANQIKLQGGLDGTLYRLIWTRGPEWGYAAITISPDGKHLTGIKWHEEPLNWTFGDSWFGERCDRVIPSVSEGPGGRVVLRAAPTPRSLAHARDDIRFDFLQRARRLPMFGGDADLDVVMRLLSEGKRVKLVARDYRGVLQEPKLNALREALQKRGADLSRVDFGALGDKKPRYPIENELMRSLYGVVEIEP